MSFVKLQFSIAVNASREKTWHTMLADQSYREWTAPFMPGSYFEGSWDKGSKILFLAADENGQVGGMVSRIRDNRPCEYISIEHLGMVDKSVEDTTSDAVKAWAGAQENYSFSETSGVTTLRVDMETSPEYADMMRQAWPQALQVLKRLAEQ